MSKKKNTKEKKVPDHVARWKADQAWLHKFIFVTVSVLVGAASLYLPYALLFKGATVKHLELSDTAALKEAFFGTYIFLEYFHNFKLEYMLETPTTYLMVNYYLFS